MFKDENLSSCDDTFIRATETNYVATTFDAIKKPKGTGPSAGMTQFSVERSEYLKKAAEQSRIERIKEVRKQEQHISRQGLTKQYKEQLKQQESDKKLYENYVDYQSKLKQLEELKQRKLQEYQTQQQNLLLAEQRNIEMAQKEREAQEKKIKDEHLAIERGKQAIKKQVEEISKISNFENSRRNIDAKTKVREYESNVSHIIAQDFREKEKQRLEREAIEKQREEAKKVYAIDRYGNRVDTTIPIVQNGVIDYSNT